MKSMIKMMGEMEEKKTSCLVLLAVMEGKEPQGSREEHKAKGLGIFQGRERNTRSCGKGGSCAIPAQISKKNSTEKDTVRCPTSFTAVRKPRAAPESYCRRRHDDLLVLPPTQSVKLKQ